MMNWMHWHRFPGLGLRMSALLGLALALAILAAHGAGRGAQAAGSTPDVAIAIDVNGGGDDCDTRPSTGGIGATCNVTVGNQFTVTGNVDATTGLTDGDGDTQMGYVAFQFRLQHTAGLTLNNPSGTDTELGFPGPFWPDCTDGRSDSAAGSNYDINCFSTGAESLFLGKVVEVTYTCSSVGTQTITMDDASSYIHNDLHGSTPADKEGNEVLTINCVTASAVGGIAEPPDVAGTPLEASTGSDSNAWLFATLAAAASVGIVAFGGVAWYARRRSHS
jgi:hypothetical protein